ncbi:hypothetical protein TSST111916_21120 [Tsukamurella strandjordii]
MCVYRSAASGLTAARVGFASSVAIAVVSGTDSASPIPPTKDRTSSTDTESEVSTCPSGRPAIENSNSSGSAEPTYAKTSVYTVEAM